MLAALINTIFIKKHLETFIDYHLFSEDLKSILCKIFVLQNKSFSSEYKWMHRIFNLNDMLIVSL